MVIDKAEIMEGDTSQPAAYMDDERFYATCEDEESANRFAENVGGRVKPFGVDLIAVDPTTKQALEWKKQAGFSVWV